MLIRSFAVPVFIGLAGGVVGMLTASKGIGLAFPYALMQVGMNSNKSEDILAGSYGGFILASLVWLLLFCRARPAAADPAGCAFLIRRGIA